MPGRLLAAKFLSASAIALTVSLPAQCRFAHKETRQVPIDRLVRNLETQKVKKQIVNAQDRALIDFRIGRLYAMSYALQTDKANVDNYIRPGSEDEVPDFGYTPDHVQFRVEPGKNPLKTPKGQKQLDLAIKYLELADAKAPTFLPAKLGLAWCLDQKGEKARALELYRRVFTSAYANEKTAKGGMYNWSITLETAGYLKTLLNPGKDAKELASIKEKVAVIEELPRYVTPVMVPLKKETRLPFLLRNTNARFDLDGLGAKNYKQWPGPDAGWLVYDPFSTGHIASGLQLIGSASFWLFFNDGFEVLSSLDDNHDGNLAGNELTGLAIWQDQNGNAVSDKQEVMPLSFWEIESISTRSDTRTTTVITSNKGVRFKSGRTVPAYDVVLKGR